MNIGEFRHYIDGELVEEPQGWREFTEKVERDYTRRLIGVQYPIDLTFVGSAYTFLSDKYADNPCAALSYRSEMFTGSGWYTACEGVLMLSDVEWNLSRGTAAVSIADDGIGARLDNNRRVKVLPKAEKTKTGEAMDPCPSVNLQVFDPGASVGTYGKTILAFDWLDLLRHCVTHITGGSVTVESAWYGSLPDGERWCVTELEQFCDPNLSETILESDFETLFGDMAKMYNLMAAIERDSDGNPVLRIEPETYFYGDESATVFDYTDDLKRKVDGDRLFATVKVGSSTHFKELVPTSDRSLPFLRLRGFTVEELTLEGACNTDATLDLTTEHCTDTNVLEAAYNCTSDKDGDNVVCFVQYDRTTSKAVKGTYLNNGTGPYLYNEAALNVNVLNRYTFPSNIIVENGDQADGFLAVSTASGPVATCSIGFACNNASPAIPGTPHAFDDDYNDGSDAGNNYGNGTTQGSPVPAADCRYTAPSQGYYVFKVASPWSLDENWQNASQVWLNISYKHKDSGGTVIATGSRPITIADIKTTVGTYADTFTFGLNMNAGEYVEAFLYFAYGTNPLLINPAAPAPSSGLQLKATVRAGATFETNYVATGGGSITTVNPAAFYSTLYEFDRYITPDEWVALRSDMSLAVRVGPDAVTVSAYVKSAERNAHTGQCKWTLIANRA